MGDGGGRAGAGGHGTSREEVTTVSVQLWEDDYRTDQQLIKNASVKIPGRQRAGRTAFVLEYDQMGNLIGADGRATAENILHVYGFIAWRDKTDTSTGDNTEIACIAEQE